MSEVKLKCTLTDNELVDKSKELVSKLCETGGHSWCLRVPVDLNNDPDIIFTELGNRVLSLSAQLSEAQGEISKLHTSIEEYEIENDKWRNYYNNLKQENAALRAELTEKEAELAKLKRQREQTEFDFRNLDKMHSVIIERHNGLLKENADLRNRLKPVNG